MENRGLLFIPDISGFTKFVNETDIDHSRLIIQELLELLINSNQLGLEISEIEGDAILFYRFGKAPGVKELYSQVEKMFVDFHKHIITYDTVKYCQCKACTSAVNLSLKVISHYGEFTGYSIKNFYKLIGKDVIAAHQLLKNDIAQHEYWLITENLLKQFKEGEPPHSLDWKQGDKQTEAGDYPFQYAQLDRLRNNLMPDPIPQTDLAKKTIVFTISREFNTDIITLFHAAGDFNYRHKWKEGVKGVEEVNHYLPRIGMRCRYLMEDGEAMNYSTSYAYSDDKIEFGETDDTRENVIYYTLMTLDDHRTKLTIDYYIPANIISKLVFNLTKKQEIKEHFEKSIVRLDPLVEELAGMFKVDKVD